MDADALDAAVARYANSWYTRGCAIGRLVADLSPGPYRDRLVSYLNEPRERVSHSAIAGAIKETLGVDVRSDALLRHRSHLCSCPAEVYR